MTGIVYSYAIGETVEALDPASRLERERSWRRGIVTRLDPYRGKAGYYVQWEHPPSAADLSTQLRMASSGGWQYEACMRKVRS